MITTNCLRCGKEFQSYSAHHRKYCSLECSHRGQGLKGFRWTPKEEAYIIANYSQMTSAQIADHLNRTKTAIDLHIFYTLNLRKKGYSQLLQCDCCGKEFKRPPSLKGKVWGNFCSRQCRGRWQAEHIIAEEHPNWQGGKMPYNGVWREIRRQARKRANEECQHCGKPESENGRRLDVHHIKSVRAFLFTDVAHTLKNVICLCRQCHIKAHHPSLKQG